MISKDISKDCSNRDANQVICCDVNIGNYTLPTRPNSNTYRMIKRGYSISKPNVSLISCRCGFWPDLITHEQSVVAECRGSQPTSDANICVFTIMQITYGYSFMHIEFRSSVLDLALPCDLWVLPSTLS